jgi:2-(1,2-epoxy-1,2-dihydrophenyl)acetyl-CoA isomerase
MDNKTVLAVDHDLFSGQTINEICILTFKKTPLLHISDLEAKELLLNYLESISCNNEIRILLIKNASVKMDRAEYIRYYKKMIASGGDLILLERMYSAINQFILKLVNLNKLVVHADSGNVILLYMNLSLACDYRIVADNTVYQNPNIELNLVPKGGGVFYLSKMLGTSTASKVLLSNEEITALQAHQLGIVDKVVPLKDFDRVALETAQNYARLPSGYAIGIKKLLSFDIKELDRHLEYENRLLRRQIHSSHNVWK